MYVLDTNVVSELRRRDRAHPGVLAWASSRPPSEFFLSAITVLELELGVQLIQRRDPQQGAVLRAWIDGKVLPEFDRRILPIDKTVALRAARLHVPNPRSERDALIAATAFVHGMTILTRNIADFQETDVSLVNPWKVSPP